MLNSGLFQAVHESRLFAADPDIGIDIENPDALQRYYDLLLSVLRLIVYAVFSRGIDNEQMKEHTRAFLTENRACMVGIFKRSARIGNTSSAHQETLHELVKAFMALVAGTDFTEVRILRFLVTSGELTYLQFEEQEVRETIRPSLFS